MSVKFGARVPQIDIPGRLVGIEYRVSWLFSVNSSSMIQNLLPKTRHFGNRKNIHNMNVGVGMLRSAWAWPHRRACLTGALALAE